MSTFILNASPRGADARSFQLALHAAHNATCESDIAVRHLVADPPEPVSPAFVDALMAAASPDTPAITTSERLIREFETATHLVVSTPMHNYSLPAALKLWFDHVLRYSRTFAYGEHGKVGLLADRPTLIIVSTGAPLTKPGSQPDHLSRLVCDLFAMMGITSVRFVYLEQVLTPETAAVAHATATDAIDADPDFGRSGRAITRAVA